MQIPPEYSEHIKILPGEPIEILVAQIIWDGPHSFDTIWKTYKELPWDTPDEEVEKSIQKLLKSRRYFKVCDICKRKDLAGFLDSDVEIDGVIYRDVCHQCMQGHGYVF